MVAMGSAQWFIDNPVNQGKTACLNQALTLTETAIVAFSDVSADLPSDAFLLGTAWFEDPDVGVVAGGYRLENPAHAGESTYWTYQKAIKKGEAALGAPLGVHGAFYMVRRSLAAPLEADTINDDFIFPMRIVARGHKAIYDNVIDVVEREKATPVQDFKRRHRIAAGNLQQLVRLPNLLNPRLGGVAFCFWAGKALRALMAPLLVTGFLGSAYLAPGFSLFSCLFALYLIATDAVAKASPWQNRESSFLPRSGPFGRSSGRTCLSWRSLPHSLAASGPNCETSKQSSGDVTCSPKL